MQTRLAKTECVGIVAFELVIWEEEIRFQNTKEEKE